MGKCRPLNADEMGKRHQEGSLDRWLPPLPLGLIWSQQDHALLGPFWVHPPEAQLKNSGVEACCPGPHRALGLRRWAFWSLLPGPLHPTGSP